MRFAPAFRPRAAHRLSSAMGWIAAVVLAVALASARPAVGAEAAAVSTRPEPIEIANGVYMLPGLPGEPDDVNLGRVGNAGFIVGRSGVLAIDTGTSYLHGVALLEAIRRVTDQPVRMAIVTHTRQEFLFGGAAFRERGIPIAMHREAAGLMASRCENCLKTLRATLGEPAMRGTTMYKADLVFTDPLAVDAAALIGRSVQILYFGHSSGPGDVAVFDVRTRTLFAGGLLDAQRIPDVIDSDLPGWTSALQSLRAMPIETIVPGHGPAGSLRIVAQVERYLADLDARARSLLKAGAPLSEVPDASNLPDFATWDQYDTVHRRNAAIVYLRREREQLLK
jgi:glyoxylase-like metal-dependent hydrolase (beta-lactamase superfamily II)